MTDTILFSLDGRYDLANKIVKYVQNLPIPTEFSKDGGFEMGLLRTQKFSDGELCVDFNDSVRGKRIYILSSPNNSDEIMKLNLAIDAAKRGAAKEIIAILPYFPYARQDKKDQSRGPIGAKVIAEMLEQRGATSVITYDLHADQIQGFFNIPLTHIEGKHVFDD
jgi:ribose-phosphate pyrophosphokinase